MSTPTADSHYADELGRANPDEAARLDALAAALDPGTLRRLEASGLARDARVLEIGAGKGTVAARLAALCPDGLITATDLDTSHLPTDLPAQVRALRHDVAEDPFPEGSFDLVHARCVLMHLPGRERVVERIRDWLAPGGTVLLEEIAHFPLTHMPEGDPVRRSVKASSELLGDSYGMEADWGLRVPQVLHRLGYTDISVEVTIPPVHPGSPMATWWSLTLAALGPRLLETGALTRTEVDTALSAMDEPGYLSFPLAVTAVRARSPRS
ncbi:methyltransferase [Streptomyces sp. NPDC089799]|uniref:class I SAM-dependent methyltransferase n=1 Tax=Streptomyces sp. NPDC089799 TaxID=3155066 RepID=UPI0034172088